MNTSTDLIVRKHQSCLHCDGAGRWQEEHPHNGSPCGEEKPCQTCHGTGVRDGFRKQMAWDERFLRIAREVSTWSKDPSTQCGAVIVSPDRSDVLLGYNGFPRAMPDKPEHLEDREEKYRRIVHCEMNAALLAKRSLSGYTLYTWPFLSCDRCCVHMIQAGITRFVAPLPLGPSGDRWRESIERSRKYMLECRATWDEYVVLPDPEHGIKLASLMPAPGGRARP